MIVVTATQLAAQNPPPSQPPQNPPPEQPPTAAPSTMMPQAPGTLQADVSLQTNATRLREMLRTRIESSGLGADEVRRRLASMGYDPRMLDPYLSDSVRFVPEPTARTLTAVRALGFTEISDYILPDARPQAAAPTEAELRANLRVFGTDVFSRGTSEFDQLSAGALPPSYILGPGDELVLVITGDVELTHNLSVTREGFVLIPQVGQVWVNGLTLASLREQLFARLGAVYSGVRRDIEATTHFDVSVGRTRSNQIYVTGEVARPGAYAVSPLASVLNALYQAGGPTGNGSFRTVRIVRDGRAVGQVDLYQYLLAGNNLADTRLENGDVIFIPVHGPHVILRGEVARAGIYELRPGETALDLLSFAGGLNAPAHTRNARLQRIVPPGERRDHGIDRVVLDLDLDRIAQNPAAAEPLRDGDEITVLAVNEEVRRTVSVAGSVWREGTYALRPGMRAWDLIAAGDGLKPDAYSSRAQITRLNRRDGSLSMIPFSLERNGDGQPTENPPLEEDDVVRVFSRAETDSAFVVTVSGEVRAPFTALYERGMTLRDAIVRAGGLRPTADPMIEISRMAQPGARERGELAEIIRVRVDSSYFVSDAAAVNYLGNAEAMRPQSNEKSADLVLRPYDQIFVRSIPSFATPRVITVAGEVKYPGEYTLRRKDERLVELIERTGGLTTTAYAAGFRLRRANNLVDIDLPAALKNPRSLSNVILLPGDSLVIPEYDPVVLVQGAVGTPSAVLYRKGSPLSYYVSAAGGYARNADKSRVFVRFANGRSETKHRTALLFKSEPTPEPGSVVTVPYVLAQDKTDTRGVIADVAQILAALGTIALAITRIP